MFFHNLVISANTKKDQLQLDQENELVKINLF